MVTLFALGLIAPTVTVEVDGPGMLRFWHEDRVVYAKQAPLTVSEGKIVHVSGAELAPPITIDSDTFTVQPDGTILDGQRNSVGRLVAARFHEEPTEQGLFASDSVPRLGSFGDEGFGTIKTATESAFIRVHTDEQKSQAVSQTVPPPSAEFLASGGVQIVLNDVTEVETEEYTLGQIATIYAKADLASALANLTVGSTPPLGANRLVTIDRITTQLKLAGYEADRYRITGSHRPSVRRKGITITHDDLFTAATEAARQTFGESAEFRPAAIESDLVVQIGDIELVAGEPRASGATLTIRVDVLVDGRRVAGRNVRLINGSPIASLRVGSTMRVLVIAGAAIVETTGTVRRIEAASNTVTVQTPSGATLTGQVNARGDLEVQA